MYVCICNAVRASELRDAALTLPGDIEAIYAALGYTPQCGQCFEEGQCVLDEARTPALAPAGLPPTP